MKHLLLPIAALTLSSLAAQAQTAITLTQSNFPATATATDSWNNALATNVAAPGLGANQTWNYASLQGVAPDVRSYAAPAAGSPFPAATRTVNSSLTLGVINLNRTSYQQLSASGLSNLGQSNPTQRYSLQQVTGSSSDSLIVPAQSATANYQIVSFPFTTGSRLRQTYRVGVIGRVKVPAFFLNNAPMRLVQRIVRVDSVAGWGTVLLPAASGGTASVRALLVRRKYVQTDSLYLNGQPAPAALVSALNLQQGQQTVYYSDWFYRENSGQTLLELYYPNASYQAPNEIYYSTEASLVSATRSALTLTGISAYPNPSASNQPLQLAALDGQRQTVTLTVRDVLGRTLATGTGITGQPTSILNGLPHGNYLLEIRTADGRQGTQRISVQ
ncbi:T9SS type A sorting domain-containing protein [Hymenobacter sp. ASUV-10]|uniref:T9SS type A sorting domain-containing protein n=1 Tax=Hymenobacter aranciens TaxID=3063996 RepID=A0ABT9BLJ9_9BACT|nr:T9SS type A sorting domain-containing protein [Hymenobacter sp. ASUV-10]MDO7877423.1 T9SS type A sorting domain-containing protein [Hymenobacter sp. ASUV-10]